MLIRSALAVLLAAALLLFAPLGSPSGQPAYAPLGVGDACADSCMPIPGWVCIVGEEAYFNTCHHNGNGACQ